MIDAETFKETYLPLGRMMFAEALRILGDASDAKDAVQDVYVRLGNAAESSRRSAMSVPMSWLWSETAA